MTMDSDLDPNAFLQSVRELKEKRQKEDRERNEQLEAQIMQDRELRQARKLERERSLSPEKTTPQSSRFSTREGTPVNASPRATPTPLSPTRTTAMPPREPRESPAPSVRSTSPSKASPGLSRSGTMSWQKRPGSISVRSRPLSAVATENSAARSPQRAPDAASEEREDSAMSKDTISQSLATKDPAWFRQTADRGRHSPAYRSGKEDTPQDPTPAKRSLPGMARDGNQETNTRMSPPAEPAQPASPSRFASVRGSSAFNSRPTSMASISELHRAESRSPLPSLDAERFAPPTRGRSSTADGEPPVVGRTMSNAQTRIAADRPVSPTKGMGGFVQSAFMKRTDSVNKRWSAQPGSSLTRQDSSSSIPSRFGSVRDNSMAASRSMPRLDQAQPGAKSQSRPSSSHRPGSSHSTISNLALGPDADPSDISTRPALPQHTHSHSRSRSVASLVTGPDGLSSPPLSPSKRWSRSPTKSSWLESALARPESPKPSLQSNQPSWMTELTKAKQQRNSGEAGQSHDTQDASAVHSPSPSLHANKPSWMAEISKAKQQRNSGEQSLSQDNLDAGRAQSIPKTADEPLEPMLSKRISLKETETRSPSARNFTPPTKAKPASLAGRPTSLEAKPEKESASAVAKPSQADNEETVSMDSTKSAGASGPASATTAGLSSPFTSPNPEAAVTTKSSSLASPKPSSLSSPKPKPETPPKKDFRSGLKPRSDMGSAPAKEEPEFKAIFGKLKKSQPEKYVAPDELKSNILRGKAGLSLSEGPQKRERKDELRDSLIKKKEEIKVKRESDPPAPKISPAPAAALPEALTIRKQLGRSGSTLNVAQPERQRRDVTPEALSLHKTLRGKARAPSPEKASLARASLDKVPIPEPNTKPEVKESLPEQLPEHSNSSPVTDEAKAPLASNKFADRFNPALASILARGPPSSNPATPRSSSPATNTATPLKRAPTTSDEPGAGGPLTHMTKNRAKGPKRRKPNAKSAPAETTPVERVSSVQSTASKEDLPSPSSSKIPSQPPPKSAAVRVASLRLSSSQLNGHSEHRTKSTTNDGSPTSAGSYKQPLAKMETPSPQTPSKSILSSGAPREIPSSARQQLAQSANTPTSRSPSIIVTDRALPQPDLTLASSEGADKENCTGSVKNAASMWGRQAQRVASRSSPIQLPTKKDEEAAMKSAGLLSDVPIGHGDSSPPRGLGISDSGTRGAINGARSPSSSGPPKPPKSSRAVSASLSSKDLPSSPDPRATEAGRCLAEYFGEIPFSDEELRLDTQSVLTSRPGESGTIKTLRKSIQEITGDGRLLPLPSQEEHILYEDSMYVCTHVFGSPEGARVTEVYLWTGLGVPESAIQDAQIFAKRIAKEAGVGQRSTQLLIIDQNREPAAFFQALGGIVIVRRGSRGQGTSNPYMLCGRPHLGHVAFDEVELSKASLCSDFPFIIARPVTLQETRIYLWTGKTCCAEAVGSARLIGMDLNPSGEIIEVEEGREPQDLLLLMSDLRSDICRSPELWSKTRNRWDHSAARLFRVTASSPKLGSGLFSSFLGRRPSWTGSKTASPERPMSGYSPGQEPEVAVKEITPFTQTDLEPEGCFVMDCGHSIAILPGPLLAKQQHYQHAFTQALLFAHDYLILAASLEDRPAMPDAKVVLYGLPREAELRFRRFDKARGVWGTEGMMAGRRMDGLEEMNILDIREVLELCCRL